MMVRTKDIYVDDAHSDLTEYKGNYVKLVTKSMNYTSQIKY